MRLYKFLNENSPQKLESWEEVVTKCPKTAVVDVSIYRGFDTTFKYGWCPIDTNRSPKDSSKMWHDLLNSGFKAVFGKPLRSCSVFGTGDKEFAEIYGNLHKIYPSDDFTVYWSDEINDCYELLEDYHYIIRKMPKNSAAAIALLFVLISRKEQPSLNKILRSIKNLEFQKFMSENFPKEWEDLQSGTLPNLTVFSKNISEKFPACMTDFVKTFYKSGNTIQALQQAAKSKSEIMITGNYYCWGPA